MFLCQGPTHLQGPPQWLYPRENRPDLFRGLDALPASLAGTKRGPQCTEASCRDQHGPAQNGLSKNVVLLSNLSHRSVVRGAFGPRKVCVWVK